MKNITKALAIGTVILAAGGIGVAAMAETSGPSFDPPFMHGQMRMGMMGQGMGPAMMGMRSGAQGQGFGDPTARLAALKTEIGITPQQSAAWDTYAKLVQDTAAQMHASREKIDPNAVRAMSPQDRTTFMTTQWELRDKAFGTVKTAAETLLASLDDAQKAKAQTSLPGLAAAGPAGMQQAGMPMMRHGMGMMMGPMGGVAR
jgi:hypothetical protein